MKLSLSLIKHHVMKVYGEWIYKHEILTSALDGGELIIIQFNSSYIYVLTQQPQATYRVSTDTYKRNSGQHKDNIRKQVAFTGKY
jgi:hypothetical protein